jgi:hypothetical protein
MSTPHDPGYGGDPQQPWGHGQPGQGHPGQQYPGQGGPGQPYPGQGQPGQPYPGQGQPGQPYPGQQYPDQGQPGQPYPDQGYPGQGHPAQPYPGQPYPGQQPGAYPGYQQPYPPQGYGGPVSKGSPFGIGTAVVGALMAIGVFLPWVSVRVNLSVFGNSIPGTDFNQSVSGIRSWEGRTVLACGVIAIGLGIVATVKSRRLGLLAAIPGAVAVGVLVKVLVNKADYDSKVPAATGIRGSVDISLSAGFWISLLMAVLVIVAGLVTAATGRRQS